MHRIFNVFIVLCLFSFVSVNSQHDHKVNVTVYYESLCPDSIAFVTKQLYPAMQKPELSKHINLTLVPYGKTNTTKDITNNFEFSCHHGAHECDGNKIHACAVANNTLNNGTNKVALDFVNCLLSKVDQNNRNADFPVVECAQSAHVPNMAYITNCAKSTEGSELLNNMGQETALIEKYLTSVPTVVFDSKFKPEDSSNAQKNFIKVLCSYIHHDQPAECKTNGADVLGRPFGIALFALVVALKLF